MGFEFAGEYKLRVEFDDGACQVVDFAPILEGELYGPLRDKRLFRQVKIDAEVHTLVWPNGADFDPAILHDWPERLEAMKKLAQSWAASARKDVRNDFHTTT